jgi:hypothetical protein
LDRNSNSSTQRTHHPTRYRLLRRQQFLERFDRRRYIHLQTVNKKRPQMTELVFKVDDNLASRFSDFAKEKYDGDQNAALSEALLLLFLQPVGMRARTQKRKLGTAEGKIKIADDFDAPLDDFKEYMG